MSNLKYSFGSTNGAVDTLISAAEMVFSLAKDSQIVEFTGAGIDQMTEAIAIARDEFNYL